MNRPPFVDRLDPHLLASRGWFFSAPYAVLYVQVSFAAAALFLLVQVIRWHLQATPINPFAFDERKKKKKKTNDPQLLQAKMQDFAANKVPESLDVIVVGGGIAGLATAAILAKAGRRVLVLEGGGQAGRDKGGDCAKRSHDPMTKFLLDQVSNGQLALGGGEAEENLLPSDVVAIGMGEATRRFSVSGDSAKWRAHLEKHFPAEQAAIAAFFDQLNTFLGNHAMPVLKVIPLWLSSLLIKTRLSHLLPRQGNHQFQFLMSTRVRDVTENKGLQALLGYTWMFFGSATNRIQCMIRSSATENDTREPLVLESVASSIASVIEKSGGRVLVNAPVAQILHNGKKVMGVSVRNGEDHYRIQAPLVVSTVGVRNTFQRLLPAKVAKTSYFFDLCSQKQPRPFIVFIGLSVSSETLEIPRRQRTWAFGTRWDELPEELILVSFPGDYAAWNSHPGRKKSKGVCILMTTTTVKDDEEKKVEELKNRMVSWACELFPAIKDHIDHAGIVEQGSTTHDRWNLLDNDLESFDPLIMAKLRPQTDVEGLLLAGQDVLAGRLAGNLYSGLLSAGVILGRDLFSDLVNLHKLSSESEKKQK